jgi:hypothetical protein
MMLTCDTVTTLGGAYALELLPAAEAEAVRVHVSACVACGERARSRAQMGEWLAHIITPEPVPDGLRQRLALRLLDREPVRATADLDPGLAPAPAPATVVPAPVVRPLARDLARYLAWLGAGLLAASLAWNLHLLGDRNWLQQAQRTADQTHALAMEQLRRLATTRKVPPAAPVSHLSRLQGARQRPQASGILAFQTVTGRWTLTVQGLPVMPAGQVYQLWSGTGSSQALVLAFRSGGSTSVPVPSHAALRPGAALVITVENGAGQNRPTGDLVMFGIVADT